ncbi:transposase [Gordonia sp. TBRC 11910]|uniref:Transposase n=1 Tax=Gordonia asplenii TaxID=2725283 RepID=A0A848L4G3_9ACTN|nr:transposase [Gordonia asplenii]
MAKSYRPLNRDQEFLLPPNMADWLPADDPVWLVIALVDRLDTRAVHGLRKTGGVGRAGYDPDMLLTLLIWGWAQGQRSSRRLEKLCYRDIAFRVICGGDPPDHVTIARFRAAVAPLIADLFAQVLAACAQVGMGQLGVVALDGVKIASNASGAANRTEKHLLSAREAEIARLREKLAGTAVQANLEHEANDTADEGDPEAVPENLLGSDRLARIDEALASAREHNQAAAKKQSTPKDPAAEAAKAAEQASARATFVQEWMARWERDPHSVRGMAPIEVRLTITERILARVRAAQQAKIDRYRPGQRGPKPTPVEDTKAVTRARAQVQRVRVQVADYERAQQEQRDKAAARAAAAARRGPRKPHRANPDTRRNITDPQSRPMPLRGGGWVQGYNCQAVTTSDGVIIATGVSNNTKDSTAYLEMMAKAVAAAHHIAAHRPPGFTPTPAGAEDQDEQIGVLLADAGYLSTDNLTADGPDRLIATAQSHKLPHSTDGLTPPAPDADPIEKMTYRLATDDGRNLYKQRSHIAETPFGHAKHNMKFRQFTSRGLTRADAEFAFHAMVHNIMKTIAAGHWATT